MLAKLLKALRPKSTRAAWAWRQRDKVSTAWTLALPGGDKTLSSAEFSEAAASFLCLPSPACIGRVGETVRGRVKIDQYGDNLQATNLVGDHWRKRHDSLVQLTYQMCLWGGVNVEMEVFNLFSGAVRQEGLSRLERAEQRQGLVPDLRITVPPLLGRHRGGAVGSQDEEEEEEERAAARAATVWNGNVRVSPVLHEMKVISCSKTRYRPSWDTRAVDVRASHLQEEYTKKAQAADRRYNGVPEGEVGPCERKLVELGAVRGLVAGNFGEVSEPWHALLSALATNRVRVTGVQRGRRGVLRSEEAERAIAISHLRVRLGVATVKAQCTSLLGRLEVLGPGTAAAVGRRQYAAQLDRQWRKEEKAAELARRQGWSAYRGGFPMT